MWKPIAIIDVTNDMYSLFVKNIKKGDKIRQQINNGNSINISTFSILNIGSDNKNNFSVKLDSFNDLIFPESQKLYFIFSINYLIEHSFEIWEPASDFVDKDTSPIKAKEKIEIEQKKDPAGIR